MANRDEFYDRPTLPAHWWSHHSNLLAGKDIQAGGTWMGVNRFGRWAAVTNYRQLPITETYSTSRGDLVKEFLTNDLSIADFKKFLEEKGSEYSGFNLLYGDANELHYFSNQGKNEQLGPGLYGLSNHLLDTPWHKVEKGKLWLRNHLEESDQPRSEFMFEALKDNEVASDDRLPETGLDLEKERLVSSMFIESEDYGSRMSTVFTINRGGHVLYEEHGYVPDSFGKFQFKIEQKGLS